MPFNTMSLAPLPSELLTGHAESEAVISLTGWAIEAYPQAAPLPCLRQAPVDQALVDTLYTKEQFSGVLLFSLASLLYPPTTMMLELSMEPAAK